MAPGLQKQHTQHCESLFLQHQQQPPMGM